MESRDHGTLLMLALTAGGDGYDNNGMNVTVDY